jgi:hypothetical protein
VAAVPVGGVRREGEERCREGWKVFASRLASAVGEAVTGLDRLVVVSTRGTPRPRAKLVKVGAQLRTKRTSDSEAFQAYLSPVTSKMALVSICTLADIVAQELNTIDRGAPDPIDDQHHYCTKLNREVQPLLTTFRVPS